MVKSDIISVKKADRLYWLGRYTERVYMTLHLLRKCYDKMIDGEPEDYEQFWKRLDPYASYSSPEEFALGMLYDEKNPCSVLSELIMAKDNAILLREDITTESLSFIELSISYMNKCKAEKITNITRLQNVTDWVLAFWGSVEQRIFNRKELAMLMVGKTIENIDMCLRFSYPMNRIVMLYDRLVRYGEDIKTLVFDDIVSDKLDVMFADGDLASSKSNVILCDINRLVRI